MAKPIALVEPYWERQPSETERAYAAFRVFLELGKGRTVSAAYRQKTGLKGAKKASGEWLPWVQIYRWRERARAYDNHLLASQQEGIDQAVKWDAAWWQARRDEQLRLDHEMASHLRYQAWLLARFPMELSFDPVTGRPVQPLGDTQLKNASAVAKDAQTMAWTAINQALPHPAKGDEVDELDQRDDETRGQWKARLREEGYGKGEKGKGSAPAGGS